MAASKQIGDGKLPRPKRKLISASTTVQKDETDLDFDGCFEPKVRKRRSRKPPTSKKPKSKESKIGKLGQSSWRRRSERIQKIPPMNPQGLQNRSHRSKAATTSLELDPKQPMYKQRAPDPTSNPNTKTETPKWKEQQRCVLGAFRIIPPYAYAHADLD
ncbi:MAG: hypothetical protein Q9220_001827 [cf. Caloplaca sp. 1 TL-2023]